MVGVIKFISKNLLLLGLLVTAIGSWGMVIVSAPAQALGTSYYADDQSGDNCDAWKNPGTIGCGSIEVRLIDGQTRYVRKTKTRLAAYFTKPRGTIRINNSNFCNRVGLDGIESEDWAGSHGISNGTAVTEYNFIDKDGSHVQYGRKYNGGDKCGRDNHIDITLNNLRKSNDTGLYYAIIIVNHGPKRGQNGFLPRHPGYDGIQNSYSVQETGGNRYAIAQQGGGDGYGVTAQEQSGPSHMTYKIRFGADCTVKKPTPAYLSYYDLDNNGGSGAQLGGKITMRLIEVGGGSTGLKINTQANGTGRTKITVKPGKRYIWEINNVYNNNTLQYSTPYDGIYYDKPCTPQKDVCPNIPGAQSSVPAGYVKQNGDCVKDHCPDVPGIQTNNSLCKVDIIPDTYISPTSLEVGASATVRASYHDTANYDKEQAKNQKTEDSSYINVPAPYCKSNCRIKTKQYRYTDVKYEAQVWFDNGDKKYREADDNLVYDTSDIKGEGFVPSGGTLGTFSTGETELEPTDDPNFLVCAHTQLTSGYYTMDDKGPVKLHKDPVYKYVYDYVGSGGNYGRRSVTKLVYNGTGPYNRYGNYVGSKGNYTYKTSWEYYYNGSGPYNSNGNYVGYGGSYDANGTYDPNNGAYNRRQVIDHYNYWYNFPDSTSTKTAVSPYDDFSEPAACSIIQRYPDMQVTGGDVRAGGSFADDLDNCSGSAANIRGHSHTVESDMRGSYGEYGVIATGSISNFGSNGVTSANGTIATELTFANTIGLGHFSNGWCFNDVFDGFPNPTTTVSSWTGGDINLGPNDRMVIRVHGPVRITGDIQTQQADLNSINQMPEFVIIADGDISVDSDVSELDGIFVTKGNFITCTGHTSTAGLSLDDTSACRTQLTVNGAVIAGNTVKAYRTSADDDDYTSPAETFNLDGATIISDYAAKRRTGEYTIIGERELPPRF